MADDPMLLLARRPAARRLRVQGLRGAVPHVDARRLRGRAAVVTGFMSTGVKAAAFAAFVRVFLSAFEPLRARLGAVVWVIAAATMIVGTVVGVAQSNVKRMLAYSSIAHGGYLLVGARRGQRRRARRAMLFYLLAYAVTNLGAFGVIALLEHARSRRTTSCATTPGLWHAPSGAGGADDDVPAVARRASRRRPASSASGTSSAPRCRPATTWLAIIGVLTERRLGLLLPARRRDDVHDAGDAEARRSAAHCRSMAALTIAIAAIFYLGILPTQVLNLACAIYRHHLLADHVARTE